MVCSTSGEPGIGSPNLEAAWADRQSVRAEVAPGVVGEIAVVLDPTGESVGVNDVNELEVELAVGDDVEKRTFQSLRKAGPESACDALQIQLQGDG